MQKLCERYGVLTEGVDFGGLVDFVDSSCEPPEKSTSKQNQEHSGDDDFPGPSHEKSSKSSSQHIPTPESCGECKHFKIDQGWIGCKFVNQRVRDLKICPMTAD
jgi:hypothetical protein